MKSIVCGAGVVGSSIAEKLSMEGLDVTVIDQSPELISKINEKLDVKAIVGPGSNPRTLKKAGASDCDILIAVTKSDETNMICCQIGHSLFEIPKKIARIRQQDYLQGEWQSLYTSKNLPIPTTDFKDAEVFNNIERYEIGIEAENDLIKKHKLDVVELSKSINKAITKK